MENMQYAEELVKEFLIFRGFTSTLQAFERELGTDIGKGFHVLSFFKKCFSLASELVLISTLSKLEGSILRYYVVHALQSGRKNKVTEFFGMYGNDLLQRDKDWTSWFAIAYLKNPSMDPQFRIYFSQEWFNALHLSVRKFLSEMFNGFVGGKRNSVISIKEAIVVCKEILIFFFRLLMLCLPHYLDNSNASSVLEALLEKRFLVAF
ncbi:hypothetical protein ACSBR1_026577 [Camellia fascicularis]